MANGKTHSRRPRPTPLGHGAIQLLPVRGLPEFREGDDIAAEVLKAVGKTGLPLKSGDIVVVAQKIVSKVEGRVVNLSQIVASQNAQKLAKRLGKRPALLEVILRESRRIVRSEPVLIVETHHGFVCANAGVDQSNVPGKTYVTLLPKDPDRTASELAGRLRKESGQKVAVIISDTFGRPWRLGLTNVAIGAAGVPVLMDLRGKRDRQGKRLRATIVAVADELATAAGLLMSKAEGIPVVVIRGYPYKYAIDPASRILRPAEEDLFR